MPDRTPPLRVLFLAWCAFACIGFGLGYATLNRYDPTRVHGMPDTIQYARMVDGSAPAEGHWSYRVLVPALARPIFLATNGHLGSWSAPFFALLCVNAALCACTALVLLVMGARHLGSAVVGLIAALLFLLDFDVANAQLAGLVDSGEALVLALAFAALAADRWWLLPLLAVPGAAAKETYAVLATSLAGGWWLAKGVRAPGSLRKAVLAAVAAVVALGTVVAVRAAVDGHATWPWEIVAEEQRPGGIFDSFLALVSSKGLWFGFAWLLPLGLAGMGRLPAAWKAGAGLATLAVLALGTWNQATENIGRPLFSVAGPLLCLGAASYVRGRLDSGGAAGTRGR